MAATQLTKEEHEVGLTAAMSIWDDSYLAPAIVMWGFDENASEWRLIVGTRYAETHGSRETYLRIGKILRRAGLNKQLPLTRVVAVTLKDTLVIIANRTTEGSNVEWIEFGPFGPTAFPGTSISRIHRYYHPKGRDFRYFNK